LSWEAGQELGRRLHHDRASFETRPLGAPQDEGKVLMALRKLLILRRLQSGRLEGRTAPDPANHGFLARPLSETHGLRSLRWVSRCSTHPTLLILTSRTNATSAQTLDAELSRAPGVTSGLEDILLPDDGVPGPVAMHEGTVDYVEGPVSPGAATPRRPGNLDLVRTRLAALEERGFELSVPSDRAVSKKGRQPVWGAAAARARAPAAARGTARGGSAKLEPIYVLATITM
jgi:hypothetical protein